MIGRLKGVLDVRGDGWVIVDVNGVGYHIEISNRCLASLPDVGEAVTLAIETYVREDQLRLFGFASDEEKGWFKLLMSVQGVGAKVALAIMGVLSVSELMQAIMGQDKDMISRAPGVGGKVAQRIVQELKDKMPDMAYDEAAKIMDDAPALTQAGVADALSALENLGLPRQLAQKAVMKIVQENTGEIAPEELIKLALQELGR